MLAINRVMSDQLPSRHLDKNVLQRGFLGVNRLDSAVVIVEQRQKFSILAQLIQRKFAAIDFACAIEVFHQHTALAVLELECAGRIDQLDLAIDDERHPITQLVGNGHVMRGYKNRRAFGALLLHDVLNYPGVYRVEAAGWLVEEQYLRPVQQAPGNI